MCYGLYSLAVQRHPTVLRLLHSATGHDPGPSHDVASQRQHRGCSSHHPCARSGWGSDDSECHHYSYDAYYRDGRGGDHDGHACHGYGRTDREPIAEPIAQSIE